MSVPLTGSAFASASQSSRQAPTSILGPALRDLMPWGSRIRGKMGCFFFFFFFSRYLHKLPLARGTLATISLTRPDSSED